MRLGYFTMPVHPIHRSWTETLKEDREAIILADKLGFYDAFMGEHLTDKAENITNSMIFNASLISSCGRSEPAVDGRVATPPGDCSCASSSHFMREPRLYD